MAAIIPHNNPTSWTASAVEARSDSSRRRLSTSRMPRVDAIVPPVSTLKILSPFVPTPAREETSRRHRQAMIQPLQVLMFRKILGVPMEFLQEDSEGNPTSAHYGNFPGSSEMIG